MPSMRGCGGDMAVKEGGILAVLSKEGFESILQLTFAAGHSVGGHCSKHRFPHCSFSSAEDRNLEDKLRACCLILSTMLVNKSFFFLPISSESPMYFPSPPSFWIPNRFLACSLASGLVLEEKMMDNNN